MEGSSINLAIAKRNVNYVADLNRSVNVSRGVLKTIGVRLTRIRRTISKTILVILQRIVCNFLLSYMFVSNLLHVIMIEKDPRRKLKRVGPLCTSLMALLKYIVLLWREDKIIDCMTLLEDDWKHVVIDKDRLIMLESAKFGRKISMICVAFVFTSGFCYRIIVPLSKGKVVDARNVTIRPLAHTGYYVFFDHQKTPFYEIIYTLQLLEGFVTYAVNSGVCSLVASYILHARGQLKVLIRRMEDLVNHSSINNAEIEKNIAVMIRHHIRANSLSKTIENAVRYSCLIEIAGTTLVLCFLGYYIILEWQENNSTALLSYIMLLITFTFNLFIYCFIGELLTDQTSKVATMFCTLDWFRLPNRTTRYLILAMAMSNRPVKVTAGKLIDLSLFNFGAIVRTSVAYLNMLRATSI